MIPLRPLNLCSHLLIISFVIKTCICPTRTNDARSMKADWMPMCIEILKPRDTRLLPPTINAMIVKIIVGIKMIIKDFLIFFPFLP